LFEFQKDFGAAEQEYEEELRASPDNGPAMTELAVTLVDDVRPDKAVPIAERAVSLEPQNPRAYYALGSALLETGKPEQGARALEKAKQFAPNSSFIRFTLAKAYRALGREEEAKRESAAFLALKDKQEVLAWPENRRATPEQLDVQGTKKP
jgi:predicted Zn-dependent protease